jgi:hypothetical protein
MINIERPIVVHGNSRSLVVFSFFQVVSCVLHFAVKENVRLFIVRVDLRFPQRAQTDQISDGVIMGRFIKSLRTKILAQRNRVRKKYGTAQSTRVRCVWVRELGPKGSFSHYHAMLVFNRDAYRVLEDFQSNDDNLARCIQGAWASALGVDFDNHRSLASFSRNGQYQIINGHGLDEVMCDMMHLNNYFSKAWDGARNIGYSLAREDLLTHRCSIQCLHA